MADAVAGLRARPKRTAALAVLLLSAGLALGLARESLAATIYTFNCSTNTCGTWPRDSDGSVPERAGDLNADYVGFITRGRTTMMYSSTRGVAEITYDYGAINYCRNDYVLVRNHERAHSRGFNHYEASYSVNSAYYPSSQPCTPA